jgi:hypothetical protein
MRHTAQISTPKLTAWRPPTAPSLVARHSRRLLWIAASLIVLSILAVPAYAQAPVVSAAVDRPDLGRGEPLALTITVNGAEGQPDLPALADFRVLDVRGGTQISTVNGGTTVQGVTHYSLLPLRTGDLLIPSIPVVVGGETYRTDPIPVTVSETAAPPAPATSGASSQPPMPQSGADPFDLLDMLDQWMQQSSGSGTLSGSGQLPIDPARTYQQIAPPAALQGQDYYAEALIDKPAAYQGEQVLYTLRLYQALDPYGQIQYQPPALSGFWSRQSPDQQTYMTQAGGRAYRVTELQDVLFPTVTGLLTIDPARVIIPGDFMDGSGVEITSQSLTLDVQPLPAGAPAGFQGAVGQYEIEAGVDKTEARVGDAVTQHVTITGAGNIEQAADPAWSDDAAWRAFDSKSTTGSEFRDGRLAGVRRIERVLVPTQPGDLTVPAAEFSYFDPAAGQYHTIDAQTATVSVTPALDGEAAPAAAHPATALGAANTVISLPAIRPLKGAAAQSRTAGASLPRRPSYWALWALPVALVAGQFVVQRRRQHERVNAAVLSSQRAAGKAGQALQAAAKKPQTAQEAAGRILSEYLSARLLRPVSGLTHGALAEALLARGVEPVLVSRVEAILARSDFGRYAPHGDASSTGDLLAETQQVIDDLERQL